MHHALKNGTDVAGQEVSTAKTCHRAGHCGPLWSMNQSANRNGRRTTMELNRLPLTVTAIASGVMGVALLIPSPDVRAVAPQDDSPPAASLAQAEELSTGFRWVAKKALPAVVSIRSVRKVQTPKMTQLDDSFGRSPFGDSPFGGAPLEDLFGELRERMQEQQGGGQGGIATGEGSGFIFDSNGLVMTNSHVVRGADEVIVTLADGREFVATEIKSDDFADVAILRINAEGSLPSLPLGDDAEMEIGDWVLAFGSPFGLDRTVTQGIISAKSRGLKQSNMRQEFLQTDAAINPGNSGGPLVNMKGEVVGINTAIETRSGGYDGVGFAVPVSLARWVGEQLMKDGKVRRAYLGVKPQDIDSELAKALELKSLQGVVVAEVTKGSPAAEAGVEVQDVIVKLNNRAVTNRQQLIAIAERMSIGASYPLVILRDGEELELSVTAAEFPEHIAEAGSVIKSLGAEVQTLTPELAQQLEMESDAGVVITNVQRGSVASRIGLRPGFVIARIGKTDVNTVDDLEKGLELARERRQLVLLVKTPNGTQLVSVPFGEEE